MTRTFKHFPNGGDIKCPICGTDEDRECFLMPIDGTEEGNNCQAQPTHVDCIKLSNFRYNKEVGLIYHKL